MGRAEARREAVTDSLSRGALQGVPGKGAMYNGRGTDGKSRWAGAAFGGDEGKQIYAKRGYTVEPVFGEIKWDGRKPSMDLRGSAKVRGEFSLLCLVHNVKKIVKRVLDGTVSLPGKSDKLIEEAVLGYRERQLTLVRADV